MTDEDWMARALTLAELGRGFVEPNPMVGCIAVRDGILIASGYHRRYGGPHAEPDALSNFASGELHDTTVYVTLEPCSHYGKTPPCLDLLLRLRPARVVVAMQDPYEQVAGRGIAGLRNAGIQVDVGILSEQAEQLNAPFLKRLRTKRPWLIAKWAMSLDGCIATNTGHSQWISGEASRLHVHRLRARVDAVMVGVETVLADNPMLNARLTDEPIARRATRIVLDRRVRIPLDCNLVNSADSEPLIVAVSERIASESAAEKIQTLEKRGCEIFRIPENRYDQSIDFVLEQLGRRNFTNVLVEGGAKVLGNAFDQGLVDEVFCFIAPKIIGGSNAKHAVGGLGATLVSQCTELTHQTVCEMGNDLLVHGLVQRNNAETPS